MFTNQTKAFEMIILHNMAGEESFQQQRGVQGPWILQDKWEKVRRTLYAPAI